MTIKTIYKLAGLFSGLTALVIGALYVSVLLGTKPQNQTIVKDDLPPLVAQEAAQSTNSQKPTKQQKSSDDEKSTTGASANTNSTKTNTTKTVAKTSRAEATKEAAKPLVTGTIETPSKAKETSTKKTIANENKKPAVQKTETPEPRSGQDPQLDKKLAETIKPLLDIEVSEEDKKTTLSVLKLLKKRKLTAAAKQSKTISNETATQLIKWYTLRQTADKSSFEKLESYRTTHEDWPYASRFRRLAEANLYRNPPSNDKIISFFKEEPVTGPGKVALARAYLAKGNKSKAKKLTKQAWLEHNLSESTEKEILTKLGQFLDKKDHRGRVNRFLFRDSKKQVRRALRAAKHLDAEERKKIDAWVAVVKRQRKAVKLIGALSEEAKKDPGIVFARARWARYKKKKERAYEILTASPEKIESPVPIDGWWKEIRRHALNALDDKKYKTAYEIAKRRGPITVNHRNQAEFMAGWIALRYLDKPDIAKKHFTAFRESADGPRTRAKSNYWLARTALIKGKPKQAKSYFQRSAIEFNTFYGQLSKKALDNKSNELDIPPLNEPSQASIKRFLDRESVKALVFAHKIGRGDIENIIMEHLRGHLDDEGEMTLLSKLGKKLDNVQKSLRVAKRAMFLKMPMAHFAYPTHSLPNYKPLRSAPEKPFLFAIARQESEFNPKIISHAGARGLMQVMPGTARFLSRRYKVKYNRSKLIKDPSYNVALASAYIADGLEQFDGNYAMTMAGFNAGPGRVRQWIKKFGDPRTGEIDPIDWIELIPFAETRNYVLKVMSNIQMYRARLGEPENALRILEDLYGNQSHKAHVLRAATN